MATISAMFGTAAGPAVLASDCLLQMLADPGRHTTRFAESVAASGDTLAIGVAVDPQMPARGSAHIYARASAGWSRQAVISDGRVEPPYGFFGASIALQDRTLVVGAPSTLNDPEIEGAVFVFERDRSGEWTRTARLLGDEHDPWPSLIESFGESVGVDWDTLVVGTPLDPENGYDSGAVYVFQRQTDASWARLTKLLADDGYGGDHFGASVSIYGDTIVIGAPEDDDFGFASGSAYVFERQPGGLWVQTAKLLPDDGGGLHVFGWAVAAADGCLLVGAPNANGPEQWSGAVYVFAREPGGAWSQHAKLVAEDGRSGGSFGGALAVDGEIALIGAPGVPPEAAYVFTRASGSDWVEAGKLSPAGLASDDQFGISLAASGNIALVGAPFHDGMDENGQPIEDAGAAYVFAVGPDADGDGTMDVCECLSAGDLDLNGAIDLQDLVFLLSSFGAGPGGDVNGDGQTDLSDLATLLAHFGETCP